MITDNALSFNTSWASSQSITTVTVDSTTVVDVTGAGSGNSPAMIGKYPASNTSMGVDIGQGDGIAIPYVVVVVTTAFVSAGAATLQVVLQSAPDNGSYSPGTWTSIFISRVFTTAQLVAGQTLMFQIPPRAISGQPGQGIPRFYKLSYTVASATFSAGNVNAGIVLNPPNGLVSTLYNSNFLAV